jgi:hypothetical protein
MERDDAMTAHLTPPPPFSLGAKPQCRGNAAVILAA